MVQDISKIADELAEELIDTEIARHPEMVSQRDTLLKSKKHEALNLVRNAVDEVMNDVKNAYVSIGDWIERLPQEEKERVEKEFEIAASLAATDDFSKYLEDLAEEKTATTLQSALKFSQETIKGLFDLGYTFQKEQEFTKAREIFRLLSLLNPSVTEIWIQLGYAFMSLSQFPEAEQSFQTASQIDPDNPIGLYYLMLCFCHQDNMADALLICDEGLKLSKTNLEWQKSFMEVKPTLQNKLIS